MRTNLSLLPAAAILVALATPAQSQIMQTFETPTAAPVSGKSVISGWAFTTDAANITVDLRIDGLPADPSMSIPCCGDRLDVQNAFPDAPLQSGFGLLFNYGELAAGPHTIGVEIGADGQDTVIVDRSVRVVKPADARFIDSFDTSDVSVDNTTDMRFDLQDVEITPREGDGSTETVTVSYRTADQALVIVGSDSDGDLTRDGTMFVANLTADQEVTPVDTMASGTATLTLMDNPDGDGAVLAYTVTVDGLASDLQPIPMDDPDASAAHIHVAAAGAAGPIVFPLEPNIPDGPPFVWQGTTPVLSDQDIDDMLNARWYVNVHTVDALAGEVRGQIVIAPLAGM